MLIMISEGMVGDPPADLSRALPEACIATAWYRIPTATQGLLNSTIRSLHSIQVVGIAGADA
jgi:hypothetical protein